MIAKNCPVCKRIPLIYNCGADYKNKEHWYCHCQKEDSHNYDNINKDFGTGAYGEDTKEKAIKKWNNFVIHYKVIK